MSEATENNPFGKFVGPSAGGPVEFTDEYKAWEASDDPFKGPAPERHTGWSKPTTPEIDWEAIKADWKTGMYTQSQLGRIHNVKTATINKKMTRAKARGDMTWHIDQNTLVTLEAAAMLEEGGGKVSGSAQEKANETAVAMRVRVVTEHRRDISRLRKLANLLAVRLEQYLMNQETAGPLWGIGTKESPADIIKKLSDSYKHIIPLERVSVGLDDGAVDENRPKGGIVYMPPRKPLPAIDRAGLNGITVLAEEVEDLETENNGTEVSVGVRPLA